MSRSASRIVGFCAVLAVAGIAGAQTFNGFKLNPRVFNDFPTSTLNFTAGPGVSTVTINESNYSDDGMGGNFANRHDALLSFDGGATASVLDINTAFTIRTNVNLAPNSNSPRKEAGIRINSPVTGDALFIVNSDAREIVAFGGGAPFFIFGIGPTGYVPGTTITMGLTYRPDTGPTPGSIEYFIDRDAGGPMPQETSGRIAFSNLEGGPVNFNVGVYGQFAPNLTAVPADAVNLAFTAMSASLIPEPATAGLLAVGSLLLARGRRR